MTDTAAGAPSTPSLPVASEQDGTYPRPQQLRAHWADLCGPWSFRHDDADAGLTEGWAAGFEPTHTITVPFAPETELSGVTETGFHPVVWYSRTIGPDELAAAGHGSDRPRLLLHLGAVDYRAQVFLDGHLVGEHEGGHTPFAVDATRIADGGTHTVVVRAEDDPHDLTQPRGKQDWHEDSHAIWYRRTTGIWQPVWLEAVPAASIAHLRWTPAGHDAQNLQVRFRGPVPDGARLRVRSAFTEIGEDLGTIEVSAASHRPTLDLQVPVARQRNGQSEQELHWNPEHPRLVDAEVTLVAGDGTPIDAVASYYGVREVAVGHGHFLLNDRPYHVRSVLNQGFWPQSHLTAPSPADLRREVELIKELGFNACRIHQKIEDPRFLFWADKLGLLVWGETPGAYEFSPVAVQRLTTEWIAAVDRDVSHPSVVTWVPFNESWGVQHVMVDAAQQAFVRGLTDLTRALDPTRPVVSNDGWEHQNTDILSIHDYEGDGARLALTYADEAARERLVNGMGPAGRPVLVGDAVDGGQPVMLTEFGGINFQPDAPRSDGWGYTSAADAGDYLGRITSLYDAVRASSFLVGSCYTQLTDTEQETNGLLTDDRRPKAPFADIRRAITGRD